MKRIFKVGGLLVALGFVLTAFNLTPFVWSKNLDLFTTIVTKIDEVYVNEQDMDLFIEEGLKNLVDDLDPYTYFIPKSEDSKLKEMRQGKYGGIGCYIWEYEEDKRVGLVLPNSPAARAGIKTGAYVLKVNGQDTQEMTEEDLYNELKGKPGSTLFINYAYKGDTSSTSIIREVIEEKALGHYSLREDGIGYIAYTSFNEKSAKEVKRAILEMRKDGMKGLVLDLRNNGGGLVREAVEICSFFLPKGSTIVTSKARNGESETDRTSKNPIVPDLPLVVLINENSASASELVSGAMQDWDRAVIVGETSFGKGLVQQTHPIGHGSHLHLTVAKYLLPSGRCIQAVDFGETEKMAEEDRKDYTTNAGRPVKDGGGIDPDLEIENSYWAESVYAMINTGRSLDIYAEIFQDNMPAEPGQWHMSVAQWEAVVEMLSSDFEFETFEERQLDRMLENEEDLDYITADDLQGWIDIIVERKANFISRDSLDIVKYLERFATRRTYGEEGRFARYAWDDRRVDSSAAVLLNLERYNNYLQAP